MPVARDIHYDLSHGGLEVELYPLEELKQYAARALDRASASAAYWMDGSPQDMLLGDHGLRERLAAHIVSRDGAGRSHDGVMLVSGAAQGLALVASAFLDPRDGVVLESVSALHARRYFQAAGAIIASTPLDDEGMNVAAVEEIFSHMQMRGIRPKLVYTIPTFHVPTGVSMSLQRRAQLLELARKWNVLIVEDNCQYELYFDTAPLPTLQSLDREGHVVQLDSFSKILAPALRIGWIAAAPAVIDAVVRVRQDSGVSLWFSRAMDQYLADGKLQPQLERVRNACRRKRDFVVTALQQHCAPWIRYRIPQGGAYFWLELSERVDWKRVRMRLAREGMLCHPDERISADRQSKQHLRLGFLQAADVELERWLSALGRAIAAGVKH